MHEIKKKIIIITCNIPNNKKILNIIIKKILDKKLSSCINVIKNIQSFYYWNNKIINDKESKIIIKTFIYLKKKIIEIINKNHIYKIPEILIFNVKDCNKSYLNWMNNTINKNI